MLEQVFIKTRRETLGPISAEFNGHDVRLRSYSPFRLDEFYEGYPPENVLYRFVNSHHIMMYNVYPKRQNANSTEFICTVHPIEDDEKHSVISKDTLYSEDEISAILISLSEKIASSNASDAVKTEATATLKKFLRLPVCKQLFGDLTLKVFNAAPPRSPYQAPDYSKKKRHW